MLLQKLEAESAHNVRVPERGVHLAVSEEREAMRLARRAVALGKDDAGALAWGGLGLALVGRELEDGAAFVDQALTLNPNLATAWHVSALIRLWLGEPEVALE